MFLFRVLTLLLCALSMVGAVSTKKMRGGYNLNPRFSFKLKGIDCSGNSELVNTKCSFKPVRNASGAFFIYLDVLKTQPKLFVEIEAWSKSSSNVYATTPNKQKMDYCSFTANKYIPNVLSLFVPFIYEAVPFPDCPFSGKLDVNFTLPTLPLDPAFVPTGDHRLDFTLTLPDGTFFWKLMVFVNAKGLSLSGMQLG